MYFETSIHFEIVNSIHLFVSSKQLLVSVCFNLFFLKKVPGLHFERTVFKYFEIFFFASLESLPG
jgi:hypothetical protein